MESETSIIGDFYPIEFEQDFILRQTRKHAIAIVPFVCIDRIINATKGIILASNSKNTCKNNSYLCIHSS